MAYISEIEAAIKAIIDVGTFQNLCNEILDREINCTRTSLGSQEGTNKTTSGTPDTYFYDGEKYIFVEYTTKDDTSTNLFNKIGEDLDKCFDEEKTKIPINRISKIIYCHTSSKLSPDNISQLNVKCEAKNVKLDLWGINEIARKIKNEYPYIAEEYLGLNIGNGQIYDLYSFIEKYNCNKTAAKLDRKFLFRENELSLVKKSLQENKITILTGQPGVGKTRLAIEILKCFIETNKVLCIRNNYSDFGNDFSRYINIHGQNIIFVDDANTFDNRLLAILDLLNNPNENIRILITVRESFVSEIEKKSFSYSEPNTIGIKKFTDNEIEELLKKNFNIINQSFIKQIQRICEGNARLAYFAAEMALDEDGYKKIHNAEQLYENYYDNVLAQSSLFNDKTIITAGIISVAGMLDKNALFNYDKIFDLCKITKEEFIHNCDILNEKEILNDLNGNVSIDEQCMNNYFIYLFLYKKKYFTLEDFLTNCYEIFPDRVVTSFNNIFSVFNSQELFDYLSDTIKNVWNFFIGKNIEEKFVKAFCNLAPDNALLYIYNKIEQSPCNTLSVEEICFDDKRIFHTDVVIDLIGHLSRTDKIQELIDLLCEYIRKSNDKIYDGISIIKSRFQIDKHSFETNYYRENQVVDSLLRNLDSDILKVFFIECSKTLLSLTSESTEEGRHRTLVYSRLITKSTKESRFYREKIWNKLIEFAKQSFCCDRILNIISVYASGWDDHTDIELLKFDSYYIKALLEILYIKDEIKSLCVLYKLNTKLKHFEIETLQLNNAKNKFLIDVIETFHIITVNKDERLLCFNSFLVRNPKPDAKLLVQFLNTCNEGHGDNLVNYNFKHFLDLVDDDSFYDITKTIVSFGRNINIHPETYLKHLWTFVPKDEIHDLIWCSNLENKNEWQFFYFQTMPEKYITIKVYEDFIKYMNQDDDKEIKASDYRDLDFIKHFKKYDEACYIRIYSIVKNKYQYNSYIFSIYADRLLFDKYQPNELCAFFEKDMNLLFDIYILNIQHDSICDYEGIYCLYFLDNYEIFRKKYVNLLIDKLSGAYIDSIPDTSKFIIKSKYYVEIIDSIFLELKNREIFDYQIEKLDLLFREDSVKTTSYVFHFIDDYYQEQKAIQNLFASLRNLDWNSKYDFVMYLLNHNDDYELFSSLQLKGFFGATTAENFISQYESELLFWKKLLNGMPNNIKYIKHRKFCDDQISYIKQDIENEKIREQYTKRLFFNE